MATGQIILTRKLRYAIFLVLTINEGGEEQVRETLEGLSGRLRTVSSRNPDAALAAVAGIGSAAWDRLFAGPRPKLLRPFTELKGDVHTAPATPGDLLLHIKSDEMDMCYEVGQILTNDFGDAVSTVEEIHGFRYFDLRDLTGFVDGTENPTGDEALEAILVDGEDPGFRGGSYVTIQRYVTDFDSWTSLSVGEQEDVFGRSKAENIEMDDDVKPSNAHIALNVIEDADGNELEIVRDNMPYGQISGSGDKGTFFIAYSKDPDITGQMLEKMFLGDPIGNYDRLLDFTTAVTGNEYFAPSVDFLDELPPAPTRPAPPAPATPPRTSPSDGSLGIGSLRRDT
ncbi:hypothetical protein GOHSU_25_00730 [Gordonia hirsuta DSM 44140 = NBRC 16056]|uniref:Peroxidase n=1 Tax=Gordonia hirsuta DSM 44140 = NBRC 16056 TaxID=1121927 RepID=L7LCR9_9ACTN|nr:Dyp-type peroxidase [Gordonia hirsuta]GAC57838.1 hypothetical protein GOHSU_25_00730 [Gordonia hirsuta DSM 44140 = NBRC 16056]